MEGARLSKVEVRVIPGEKTSRNRFKDQAGEPKETSRVDRVEKGCKNTTIK
jgi:hypothetical protein